MTTHPFLRTLNPVLSAAERGNYAVGSFSPRTTAMILPVLKAGQAARSPLIVQISQKELNRYQVTPQQFADESFFWLEREKSVSRLSALDLPSVEVSAASRRLVGI